MGKFGQQASSVVQVATTAEDARLGTETEFLRKQAQPAPQQMMQSQTSRTTQQRRWQREVDDDSCCCVLGMAMLCCCFVVAPSQN